MKDLNTHKKCKILVVGDLILDIYIYGNTTRISPEAPIPVVKKTSEKFVLGGACNVAANLSSLGAQVTVLGVVGKDKFGELIKNSFDKKGIKSSLITSDKISTINKTRIVSSNQQLVRIDDEELIEQEISKNIINLFKEFILNVDLVVFSDYGKGTLAFVKQLIDIAKDQNKSILVDPKGANYEKYSGASLIKPNYEEFELVVGKCQNLSDFETKAKSLLIKLDLKYLLITKGSKGMSFFSNLKEGLSPIHLESKAVEVFDVTGAGDTVLATLAYFLSQDSNIIETINFANIAGGIVVGKSGTGLIHKKELFTKINENFEQNYGILSQEDLVKEIKLSKIKGDKIVFTNGVFDLIHIGHVRYLQKSKKLGDKLVVAVNSDSSVKMLDKGKDRPINSLQNRMEILNSLDCVDWVVGFKEKDPELIIKKCNPDVLVKGQDYSISEIIGSEFVLANGGEVHTIPLEKGYSTTNILNKIKLNNK